jgi:thymidine kinase
VDQLKREVYVAGLSGDYRRMNFGQIHTLIPVANEVKILNDTFCSVCAKNHHKRKALFTHRVVDTSGQQVEVGSSNYIPVCRECYLVMNQQVINQ